MCSSEVIGHLLPQTSKMGYSKIGTSLGAIYLPVPKSYFHDNITSLPPIAAVLRNVSFLFKTTRLAHYITFGLYLLFFYYGASNNF